MKKFFQQLSQLERLDGLIRRKSTGSPQALALRLGVSERTVYNLMDALRSVGADIEFCKISNSYCYKRSFSFKLIIQSDG